MVSLRHVGRTRLTVLRIVPGVAYRRPIVVDQSLVIAKQRFGLAVYCRSQRALALPALWELTSGQFGVRHDQLVTVRIKYGCQSTLPPPSSFTFVRDNLFALRGGTWDTRSLSKEFGFYACRTSTIEMLTRILNGAGRLHDWTQFQSGSIYSSLEHTRQTNANIHDSSNGQIFVSVHISPGFYLQNPRSEAASQPIVCQTSRPVIPGLCDIITNIWIMETGVFWLTQANARRPAGWRRNSIPRYLNTSQLRVMYEGCVSYVYFRHFLHAHEFECHLPSPVHSSQFIPARHTASILRVAGWFAFSEKRTARAFASQMADITRTASW